MLCKLLRSLTHFRGRRPGPARGALAESLAGGDGEEIQGRAGRGAELEETGQGGNALRRHGGLRRV